MSAWMSSSRCYGTLDKGAVQTLLPELATARRTKISFADAVQNICMLALQERFEAWIRDVTHDELLLGASF